jgi:hypothetical protein
MHLIHGGTPKQKNIKRLIDEFLKKLHKDIIVCYFMYTVDQIYSLQMIRVCVTFAADFILFMFKKISQGMSQVPYIYNLN